jgi:competence protein ComEC
LKAIILLLAIWVYANITGLAPSVQRSAVMFSFITVGGLLKRNTTIFHSLFASLFVLLSINPLLLFEIGFQLSYEAVFGIVIFQKPIHSLWKPRWRIVNYFWELATVSTAAQLGTFPHALYYFGQFPNYFLLTNLSVILLSTVIIASGMVVLAFSFSKTIFVFLGKILTLEIKLMNSIVTFIDGLPGALTQNINVHFLQLIVLLFLIFFLALFVLHPRRQILLYAYGLLTLLPVISFITNIDKKKEVSVTCYALSKQSAINFNYHGESVLLNNFMGDKSHSAYQYHIKNHEQQRKINSQLVDFDEDVCLPEKRFLKRVNVVVFNDQTFLICRKGIRFYNDDHPITVDHLILCDGCTLKPEFLERSVCFKGVIIDESVSCYYQNLWKDYCVRRGIQWEKMGESIVSR